MVELDTREVDESSKDIVFDRVLAIGDDESDDAARLGTPYLEGASVKGEIVEATLGDKIHVVKYKRRKGYRRKIGHRQKYLAIRIDSING